MPQKGLFDAKALLAYEKAHLVRSSRAGLLPDESLTLRWDIPRGSLKACQEWAYENRRTITSVTVENEEIADLHRSVSIQHENMPSDRQNFYFYQSFAKGLATAINWSEARIIAGRSSASNSKSADSLANTTSDSPNKYLIVRFPNIDPLSIYSLAGNLALSANQSVDGYTIESASWHLLFASVGREDDGSGSIDATFAQPQYTLQGYSDFDTTDSRDVYYLWGVPKSLAQTIMDAWKAVTPSSDQVGRSATASYSREAETVDIILSKLPDVAANMSKTIPYTIGISDTHHWAWGYSESQLSTFIDAHKAALAAGQTRTVRTDVRRDGLFDAHIIERATTPMSLTGGQSGNLSRTIEHEEMMNQTAIPILTAAQGVSYEMGLRYNDDNTVNVSKAKITRNAIAKSGIVLSNLRPEWNSRGYTETAHAFDGVTTIPAPAGTYYYIERLNINDDGTLSGIRVDIHYEKEDDDQGDTPLPAGNHFIKERFYESAMPLKDTPLSETNLPVMCYREITWHITWSFFSGPLANVNAHNWVSGGDAKRSSIQVIDDDGSRVIAAIRAVVYEEGDWTWGGNGSGIPGTSTHGT